MTESTPIDCRGLACPQPVLRTKEALESATATFEVIVDNEAARTNVTRFAESQGARVSASEQGGELHLTIEPGAGGAKGEAPPIVCDTPTQTGARNLVVYVSSEGMGRGDDELGGVLMAAFLDTLAQFKDDLSHVIFVNGGAKLTVEGSPVLAQLRGLEELGAELLVCGTCLNHFGVKEQLAVGSVSNMFAILETLSNAGRIIRP